MDENQTRAALLDTLSEYADKHIAAWKDGAESSREVADAIAAIAAVEDHLLTV